MYNNKMLLAVTERESRGGRFLGDVAQHVTFKINAFLRLAIVQSVTNVKMLFIAKPLYSVLHVKS